MVTYKKRHPLALISSFSIILILLLIFLSRYSTGHFMNMSNDLKNITETEFLLLGIAANVEENQLKQHILLEKMHRSIPIIKEGITGRLMVIEAEFDNLDEQIKKDLRMGIETIDKKYREPTVKSGKYLGLYNFFIGVQGVHQKFENDAKELIDLIMNSKFQEAENLFDKIENEVEEVTNYVDLILVRLEDFTRESVETTEANALSAVKMTKIITIIELLIAIILAFTMFLYILRYIRELKKNESELRQHRDNLEELVEKRTGELKHLKESYEDLYNEAPVGYHEIDKDGIVTRVNTTESQLLDRAPEEMIGRPIFDFVSPGDREKSREAVRAKLLGEVEIKPFEREYMRKDGSTFIAYIEEKILKDENDQIIGMRSALLDISKYKKPE